MYNTKQGNASTGFEDSPALFFPKYFQKQLLIKFGIKFSPNWVEENSSNPVH